jgi:hypothetical protein
MDTVNAAIEADGDRYFIAIALENGAVRIPISDDSPNHIKSAFNSLIQRARSGEFRIDLQPVGDDLFSQVAKEYVTQLNKELAEVCAELEKFGLLIEADQNRP